MNDKTEPTLREILETVEYLGTELIKYQQATRDAVITLAEAVAGVRQKIEQAPVQASANTEKPESTFVAPPAPEPEPPTEPVSVNDLRDVFAEKSRNGHKDALKALLESYGAKKLPDLPADKLAEVKAKADAL